MSTSEVKEYYRRLTEVDIGRVARDLLRDRVVQEYDDRFECDCPNHASDSGRSLHILLHKQGWYCFGCSVGGDVLQLVEFVRSGHVTRGVHGPMPESHRQARSYLADLAGMPPLGMDDVSPQQLAKREAERTLELRTQEALTELARFYHRRLRDSAEALSWLKEKYGLTDKTIDRFLIGFSDNDQGIDADGNDCAGPLSALARSVQRFDSGDLLATGAFLPTNQDGVRPFFDRRIIFPYWSRGRVVFMIGRRTPWTPDSKWEKGKYKKLLVHDAKKRRYVAPCVHNGYIYNEDCLIEGPKRVLITEGVTDCISAIQCGIPCISPVTTKFRKKDIDRLARLTERAEEVVICNDSEENGAGEEGALATATALNALNRDVRIATIPRPEGKAKIDVNELVASQGAEALNAVLAGAKRYPEFLVERIPADTPAPELDTRLAPILELITEADPLTAQAYIDGIVERFGLKRRPLNQRLKEVKRQKRLAIIERNVPEIRPRIQVNGRQLSDIVLEVGKLLVASSQQHIQEAATGTDRTDGVPIIFERSGCLVRLIFRGGQAGIGEMDHDAVYAVITRLADWFRITDDGVFPVFPPKDVSRDIHTIAPHGLSELDSVIATPVFGEKGELVEKPGYSPANRLWLQPIKGSTLREVPKAPTPKQVDDARMLITDELLVDFPFTGRADRASAVAALLLPLVRRMISGPAPIHLVEAPTPGTGKSLLCNLISIVATGTSAEARTLPEQEEEVRKSLTAELARARPVILIDNASERKKIDSSALASIATAEIWTDRLLGSTRMLSLVNRALWMLTANNPRLSNELTRRCIRIRVDPQQDRPWQRKGFKHDPITEWAADNRSELVHAALTLVQAWIREGSPTGTQRLGSFERWSAVMDGVLQVAGIEGFLENLDEFYADADTEGEMWREFTVAWWEAFRDQAKRIGELNDLCEEHGLMSSVRGDKGTRSQQSRLGFALRNKRDRVFGELRVEQALDSGRHHGRCYRLVPVEGSALAEDISPQQGDLWEESSGPFLDSF